MNFIHYKDNTPVNLDQVTNIRLYTWDNKITFYTVKDKIEWTIRSEKKLTETYKKIIKKYSTNIETEETNEPIKI